MRLKELMIVFDSIAPLSLAESWDNVGLLVGDEDSDIDRVMTCLTLSQTCLREAVEGLCQLVVCHHPIPFKPLDRITASNPTGRVLLLAMRAGIAIYSPHTAWDNAAQGINQQLAIHLGLDRIEPLQVSTRSDLATLGLGSGRMGTWSQAVSLKELSQRIVAAIPESKIRTTHSLEHVSRRLGIVCGSGGSLLKLAADRGCDTFLTGEATYHQCLEAEARGIAMVLMGHHASEFFAMKRYAELLSSQCPKLTCWASINERSSF